MSLPEPLYALVVEQERRKTKKGDRFFWQVVLRTEVGNIKAFMWNATQDANLDPKFPHKGDIIEVVDLEDQMEEKSSIVINSFKRLTKEALPEKARSIVEFEKASDEEIKHALDVISDKSIWECPHHYKFAMTCLQQVPAEKLRSCPAATQIHHHYHGGLLVHTAEVLELCKAVVESSVKRYSFINRDVLYASAILHDIGKAQTYSINDIGLAESMVTEKIIGHLFYGMALVQETAKKMHDDATFDDQPFINEVLHCIASHHGLIEWGSLKVVQSIEAGILSRIDYISSRNGMVEHALKDAMKAGQPLQSSFTVYGDPYFATVGMKKYVGEIS